LNEGLEFQKKENFKSIFLYFRDAVNTDDVKEYESDARSAENSDDGGNNDRSVLLNLKTYQTKLILYFYFLVMSRIY
jgi:hypothetical protein